MAMPARPGVPSTPTGSPWFGGRLVMLGFGSIGQGVLPLLLNRLRLSPQQILVISPGRSSMAVAEQRGVATLTERIDAENLAAVLGSSLRPGDFLLNLSVDVSSIALVAWCQDDPLVERQIGEELAQAAPAGPRLVFPTGGHNLQKTHAVELGEVLVPWVRRLLD